MALVSPPPGPMRVSRLVHAPRAIVFSAWCAPEHVSSWFAPEGLEACDAKVEPRTGGAFSLSMRTAGGQRLSVMEGEIVEIVEPERLVFTAEIRDGAGAALFEAHTTVVFADVLGGTRVDVAQSHVLRDPERAALMTAGAPKGWASSLENLERHAMAMQGSTDADADEDHPRPGVVHGTFRLERLFETPVERVWAALTTPEAKAGWFSGPPDRWELLERRMDVRPGGEEVLVGRWEGGVISRFEARYFDVAPPTRLVFAYAMMLGEKKVSVSLATWELARETEATRLTLTEQGAFLDGYDDAGARETGSGFLLDALAASLAV